MVYYNHRHFNSHAHVERDAPALLRYVHGGYFNSHAHVERDAHKRLHLDDTEISTHTLTWSVTPGLTAYLATSAHFNSHAHVERDNPLRGLFFILSISTHTLTWSVTQCYNHCKPIRRFQLTRSRGA